MINDYENTTTAATTLYTFWNTMIVILRFSPMTDEPARMICVPIVLRRYDFFRPSPRYWSISSIIETTARELELLSPSAIATSYLLWKIICCQRISTQPTLESVLFRSSPLLLDPEIQ